MVRGVEGRGTRCGGREAEGSGGKQRVKGGGGKGEGSGGGVEGEDGWRGKGGGCTGDVWRVVVTPRGAEACLGWGGVGMLLWASMGWLG